ncbi:hypothetical protein BY996DRAFT_7120299 [Phakopsora pachyrhizi]|nr:hypothetical protein BY996DRAFT_7120299 [Phakopsora pachyrhizi]
MQGMKERFRFFGNKKSKKGGDVRERVKLAGKAPEEEAKLTQNAPQYLRENMDYYENLNNHFRKPPGVEEYKSMRSHLELRTASPNYVELLNFFDGFLDSEGKIITKYSRSEFEGILEDFNLKFSELMLTEVESEMWRNALALVAFKVFDNNAIDLADSPNKYFREIMAALLVNSKAGHDNGMPNLSRYIYQKVLYDKIAEVHLVGKDIPYELSRIEIKGEYYDFYGHFFIGDRNFELSGEPQGLHYYLATKLMLQVERQFLVKLKFN